MVLGRKIDDITGIEHLARVEHEHIPQSQFVRIASILVGREVLGELLFELQGDASPHHADAIDRVDQCFRIGFQNVAFLNDFNHGRVIVKNTNRSEYEPSVDVRLRQCAALPSVE